MRGYLLVVNPNQFDTRFRRGRAHADSVLGEDLSLSCSRLCGGEG